MIMSTDTAEPLILYGSRLESMNLLSLLLAILLCPVILVLIAFHPAWIPVLLLVLAVFFWRGFARYRLVIEPDGITYGIGRRKRHILFSDIKRIERAERLITAYPASAYILVLPFILAVKIFHIQRVRIFTDKPGTQLSSELPSNFGLSAIEFQAFLKQKKEEYDERTECIGSAQLQSPVTKR